MMPYNSQSLQILHSYEPKYLMAVASGHLCSHFSGQKLSICLNKFIL